MNSADNFVGLRPGGGRRAAWLVPLGLLAVLAVPVAVWWLVGDLSTYHDDVNDPLGPDRMYPPLDVSPRVARRWGVTALVTAAVTPLVLLWALVTSRLDGRWALVLLPLGAAGALVGFAHRVATAGVIGANIGGALMMFVLLPVAGLLVLAALVAAAVAVRAAVSRRPRPPRVP